MRARRERLAWAYESYRRGHHRNARDLPHRMLVGSVARVGFVVYLARFGVVASGP